MPKHAHEIRDPVHVFVRLDNDERRLVNSAPFQRLRHIHQLALSFLIYPGATHRRFEHSLGVMEVATRIFDVIRANPHPRVAEIFPDEAQMMEWRKTLRMAALCHDLGHLPFSHAAEHELLPAGMDHENLTISLVEGDPLREVWGDLEFTLRPDRIAKLAVGQKKLSSRPFSKWENILSQVIIGDSFGADRIDYLLRDSIHTGVSYGKFDHYRLIDTLRVLPESDDDLNMPALGIEAGGRESAEALLLARYFMYSQVYFHHIRIAYNIHLQDFMEAWLGLGSMGGNLSEFLELTDNEVSAAIAKASRDSNSKGHEAAYRIKNRRHLRLLYERNPTDQSNNIQAVTAVHQAAVEKFGKERVRRKTRRGKNEGVSFPVLNRDQRISNSVAVSEVLQNLPLATYDYVFVMPEILDEATRWLKANREDILAQKIQEGV